MIAGSRGLPGQRLLAPYNLAPGPGPSSHLHPTSHPCRTLKPPCSTADKGMYFIWDFTQLNVRPHSRVGLLKYKIAPKCSLSGPFRHSSVGRNPGAVRPVRSYNLNFTYPCQLLHREGRLRHHALRTPGPSLASARGRQARRDRRRSQVCRQTAPTATSTRFPIRD